jgi:hypothetical protein
MLILCSSPAPVPLVVDNTAPRKIDARRPSRLKLERAQPEPLLAKVVAAPAGPAAAQVKGTAV